MKEEQTFDELIETKINGNVSEFRRGIEKMSKKKLVRFIMHARYYDEIARSLISWATD